MGHQVFRRDGRRTNIARPKYLPQATAAGQAAGAILVQSFGEADWIFQVVEAVQIAVDRGIRQLGQGQQVSMNEQPLAQGAPYRMPPRTAEQLKATEAEAAVTGTTNQQASFEQLKDPAKRIEDGEGPDSGDDSGSVFGVFG